MLTPRLTNCTEDISSLIEEIDCKLARMAGDLYNNMTLILNIPVSTETMIDLLTYKRILQYKQVNVLYASDYTIDKITSKVKILKYK
jgi:hypothetical protein